MRNSANRTVKRAYFKDYEVASRFRAAILGVKEGGVVHTWKKYMVELVPRSGGGTVVAWTPSVESLTNNG